MSGSWGGDKAGGGGRFHQYNSKMILTSSKMQLSSKLFLFKYQGKYIEFCYFHLCITSISTISALKLLELYNQGLAQDTKFDSGDVRVLKAMHW